MKKKALAMEFVGTLLLTAAVIGSAFSAKTLAPDSLMLQVAINGLVTAAMLGIIIRLGAATSGAHYNPAVSIALFFHKAIKVDVLLSYLLAQCFGAIAGAALANAMYDSVIFTTSTVTRSGRPLFIGEVVATAGLVWLVMTFSAQAKIVASVLPAWIFAGYFFTASSSFANPAVTLGRVFTSAPSGISPDSILIFIVAQLIGAAVGYVLFSFITSEKAKK